MVKQAAGTRPVPIGQVMEVRYFRGEKYLEVSYCYCWYLSIKSSSIPLIFPLFHSPKLDVNMGSSSIVRGVMSLVFGYITNLVVDMAFVVRVTLILHIFFRKNNVHRITAIFLLGTYS